MNKRLNHIFIFDCVGLVILFACIVSTFEKYYGFKIFTNFRRPGFYYWIGMFYYVIISCWLDYQLILTKDVLYEKKISKI